MRTNPDEWVLALLAVGATAALLIAWGFGLLRSVTSERMRTEADPGSMPPSSRRAIQQRVGAACASTAVAVGLAWPVSGGSWSLAVAIAFGLSALWFGWFLSSVRGRWWSVVAVPVIVLAQLGADTLGVPSYGAAVVVGLMLPLLLSVSRLGGGRGVPGAGGAYKPPSG